MRLVENETRLTMNKRRNFVNYADMTLSDGTVLHLTPSDFRISGQSFTDDWVDGEAFQIGTAIGKTATLLLDNTDGRTEEIEGEVVTYLHGKFSEYDFYMAYFVLYVCLPEAYHYEGELRDQMIRIGTFTVTTPTAHGSTIEITGVDNMYMFDKSFDDCDLDFSTNPTLLTILNKCCEDCGVAIGYGSFNNQNLTVNKKPEGVTYRQVVSYIALIAGCNAKISDTGALILRWYDTSVFTDNWLDGGIFDDGTPKYVTGDDADGGSFNPWNTGYVIDGGDFATPLDYHNLISTNGTSVSTDDIQFTGVLVQYEDTSAHYPDTEGWDNYAMVISDNPFVAGYEDTIALYIYNQLKDLKFRPFTTSSIQDPTIEAGDCALVYDVKGNMYKTIITNVTFKTGGMTELSCNAESPARQNSRYVNPAAQAVAKAEKKMNDYNAQVAHFNEIASQALGYFKTEEIDADTGATITYLHNNSSLISSQNIIKIASGIIAISDDGGESWNQGFDASTGTMLLNLIYVHGLTADWIRTGQLTVGGVDNIDGIIHVVNEQSYASSQYDGSSHIGEDWGIGYRFGYTWLKPAGTYKITKITVSNVSSVGDFLDFKYWIQISTDNGSNWTKVYEDDLIIGDNIISYVMNITATDDIIYRVLLGKHEILSTDPTFNFEIFTTSVNTIIDNQGVEIKRGSIKLNNKNSFRTSAYGTYMGSEGISFGLYYSDHSDFEVDASTGKMFARKGIIAGYDIDPSDGFKYNTDEYFCQYSKYKIHLGGLWNNDYWTFFGVANKGEFIHLDYGQSSTGGIWITANGANDMWDFSYGAMHITKDSISCDAHGSVAWAGSDRKLKKNIEDLTLDEAYNLVNSVKPRKFEFISTAGKRYGFIAQELKEVLDEDSGIEFETENICNINYNDFIAPLCMIVKEQQAEIDDLKKRVEALETLVNTNK